MTIRLHGSIRTLEREEAMKLKDIIVFHKEKIIDGGEVILLDENNTFYNIRLYFEKKYPNVPIEIVNEGRGDR